MAVKETESMNPVIKQYAARGRVDRFGSISPIKCAFESTVVGDNHSCESPRVVGLRLSVVETGEGSSSFGIVKDITAEAGGYRVQCRGIEGGARRIEFSLWRDDGCPHLREKCGVYTGAKDRMLLGESWMCVQPSLQRPLYPHDFAQLSI